MDRNLPLPHRAQPLVDRSQPQRDGDGLGGLRWFRTAALLAAASMAACDNSEPKPLQVDKDVYAAGDVVAADDAGGNADASGGASSDTVAVDTTSSDSAGPDVAGNASDSATSSGSDAKPGGGQSQSTWSPSYPGVFYGCSSKPAESECFIYVHPLPDPPAVFTKACEEDEVLHENGCPALLEGETAVATCQDFEDPKTNTGFTPYEVYIIYEGQVLEAAKASASATETASQACKRLIKEFSGTFCPVDAVLKDIGLGSINCDALD